TPAFFDSTGLSIAYSSPVIDPSSGELLGVISSRLKFERIRNLDASKLHRDSGRSVEYVTDHGTYFSEAINSGRQLPPVPPDELAIIVKPLVDGEAHSTFVHNGNRYLSLFRLRNFTTLDGGGIQVLVVAGDEWLSREIRQARHIAAGLIVGSGTILLLFAILIDRIAAARLSEQRALAQRNVAESTLAELAAYKTALDQHAIVSAMDAHGTLIDVNQAYCARSGRTRESLIGMNHRVVGENEETPEVWTRMWSTLSAGETWQGEACNKSSDGSRYWVNATVVPIKDVSGRIVRFVDISTDITEQKTTAIERDRANQAEAASQAKSEFLANMSHEIRTPLNGVVGLLDLLLGTELTADQRRYGRLAKSSATLLTSVLGDILDLSKIEAGKLDLSLSDFNLHETIEEAMDMLAQPAVKKGLETICYIDPRVPIYVHADPDRLRQVIVNLVNNAVKFTKRGSIILRATAESVSERDAVVRFTVTDTGIGIHADQFHRLFKAFSQADRSMTREFGGTGLGLIISKQLVELMGGNIGVESEFGRGSTFWFTVRFTLPERVTGQSPHPRLDPRELRILWVDDSELQRTTIREQFAQWGIDISTAAGGEEALQMLDRAATDRKPFHVAVIDREMPGMDGFELAMHIRSSHQHYDTALMIILSSDDAIEPTRVRRMGFSGSITKPILQSQLFDSIMDAIAAAERHPAPHTPPPPPHADDEPKQPTRNRAETRILVAEDNEVNQIVTREVLTKSGFQCEIVPDGEKAVRAMIEDRFDLILMDCQMPIMNGFDAAREIRRLEQAGQIAGKNGKPILIVALTANAMKGDRERCLEAGMNAYTSKPINPPELIRAITSLLDQQNENRLAA
ncbi:MAG: response regulator, partial [Phycisphaerae bacterium]|nr:response regulator [Phycisphaerae bacterium]